MIGTLLRILWRVFVGILAIGFAYSTFFLLYPYLGYRLPLLINLIILYILLAYFIIPLLLRLWHLVYRNHHLPLYATSADGWSSDPINIAVVCRNRRELKRHMTRSGWRVADPANFRNSIRLLVAIFLNKSYPTAPFSNLYLFGRPHDIGFQIESADPPSPRHRHHVRFWQLTATNTKKQHDHTKFWQSIFQLFPAKKRQIWIGAATHDIGSIALSVNSLQITHKIDSHTDKERDYVIKTLEQSHAILRKETVTAGEPIKFRGQTFGVNIVTTGKLKVLELRKSRKLHRSIHDGNQVTSRLE